jgi:hypothetical protein
MTIWDREEVPRRGWVCETVFDSRYDNLGAPLSQCEMCGNERVRFVHVMAHPELVNRLHVGCNCARNLSGDSTGPREREASLRGRDKSRSRWLTRKWRISERGNDFLNTDSHIIIIYPNKRYPSKWSFKVDDEFGNGAYETSDLAKLAAFEVFWNSTH